MKKTKRQKRKRAIKFLVLELLAMVILIPAAYASYLLDKLNTTVVEDVEVNEEVTENEELTGYTDIAVFGLDNRSTGDYESGNSDTIIIISINNDTKEINMVSVYRDTYLDVSDADSDAQFRKINAAYAYGGASRALSALNKNLDLDIDYYVSVDFTAVADAIDLLGGVEITVEQEELQYLNKYISETASVTGGSSDLVTEAGTQTLNGVQAVCYARIRYTSGGDYKRAQRQRIVIEAIFDKVKGSDLITLTSMAEEILPEVETNMSTGDILTLAVTALTYEMDESEGFPFDRTTMTIGDIGSCVIPCTLESNVILLHEILYGDEDYEPSNTVLEYSDTIIYNTGATEYSAVDDDFSLEEEEEEGESDTE